MSKQEWFKSYEMLVEKYMEEGYSEADAETKAENEAHEHSCDRLADAADRLNDIAKGN